MPVVAFTGTSTGAVYKVGVSYQSAGRTYTAQADGTFKTTNKDGTARSTVGSSQSSTATFFVSPSLASGVKAAPSPSGGGAGKSGPVKGAAAAAAGTAPYAGSGPGSLPVLRSGSGAPPSTTQLWWDGVPISINKKTSDGDQGEARWGEWGGAMFGVGVMFDDLVLEPNRQRLSNAPKAWEEIKQGAWQAVTSGYGAQGELADDLAAMRLQMQLARPQ